MNIHLFESMWKKAVLQAEEVIWPEVWREDGRAKAGEEAVQVDRTAWIKLMRCVWHIQDEQESLVGMAQVQAGGREIYLEKLKKNAQ